MALSAVVTEHASCTLNKEAFIDKVTRQVSALLQVPSDKERKRNAAYSAFTPRRSRRIAGAGFEFPLGDMTRRSSKKVMRTLNNIGESDGINQQAQEEYAKVFSEPLSTSNIQALAALFGWSELESMGNVDAAAALVV
jgi:hypothetical protein